MPKTSSSKRNFKVVIVNKEHGLYCSSSPSSAARKAVSKLCATDKKKKVEFSLREITRESRGKTYGPYLGYIEKLKVPIKLKGRLIEYKPNAKLIKKTGVKKGGMKPPHVSDWEWHAVDSSTGRYKHPERLRQAMYEHFAGKRIPENFTENEKRYMNYYASYIPKIENDDEKWDEFRKIFEKETDSKLLELQKKVRECEYFPFKHYIENLTECDDYLYLVGEYSLREREYMRKYCHYMSSLSNKNINSIKSTTEQEIYELELSCGFMDWENVSDLQEVVDQHMRYDSNKVSKIANFKSKSEPIRKLYEDIVSSYTSHYSTYFTNLNENERKYVIEYLYYMLTMNKDNNSLNKIKTINNKYNSLGNQTRLHELKQIAQIIYDKMKTKR